MNVFNTLDNNDIQGIIAYLERGGPINIQDNEGYTLLSNAAVYGYTGIARLLLQYGADPDIQSKNGNTALISASRAGYTDVVDLLLQYGANPNIVYRGYATALSLTDRKNVGIIQLLLLYGAK